MKREKYSSLGFLTRQFSILNHITDHVYFYMDNFIL